MVCPSCHSAKTVYDPETGEECCGSCGMVIDHVDAYQDGFGIGSHTPILPGAGSTVVGHPGTGPSRLRKSDARCRVQDASRRLSADRMVRMRAMHETLGLPDAVRRHAEKLYTELMLGGFMSGRSIGDVTAASAYVACRDLGVPRTLRNIAAASGIKFRTLSRYVRQIIDERGGALPQHDLPHLVSMMANTLGVDGPGCREAIEAAGRLDASYVAGKSPVVVAAAVLYMALSVRRMPYSQRMVAAAAGVTTVSVRKRSREIRNMGVICGSAI